MVDEKYEICSFYNQNIKTLLCCDDGYVNSIVQNLLHVYNTFSLCTLTNLAKCYVLHSHISMNYIKTKKDTESV